MSKSPETDLEEFIDIGYIEEIAEKESLKIFDLRKFDLFEIDLWNRSIPKADCFYEVVDDKNGEGEIYFGSYSSGAVRSGAGLLLKFKDRKIYEVFFANFKEDPNENVSATICRSRHEGDFFEYDGGTLNGKPHGKGSLISNEGNYSGSWQDGLFHGEGFLQYLRNNSEVVTRKGEFEKGEFKGKEAVKLVNVVSENEQEESQPFSTSSAHISGNNERCDGSVVKGDKFLLDRFNALPPMAENRFPVLLCLPTPNRRSHESGILNSAEKNSGQVSDLHPDEPRAPISAASAGQEVTGKENLRERIRNPLKPDSFAKPPSESLASKPVGGDDSDCEPALHPTLPESFPGRNKSSEPLATAPVDGGNFSDEPALHPTIPDSPTSSVSSNSSSRLFNPSAVRSDDRPLLFQGVNGTEVRMESSTDSKNRR